MEGVDGQERGFGAGSERRPDELHLVGRRGEGQSPLKLQEFLRIKAQFYNILYVYIYVQFKSANLSGRFNAKPFLPAGMVPKRPLINVALPFNVTISFNLHTYRKQPTERYMKITAVIHFLQPFST
jgi:hypothetical protein